MARMAGREAELEILGSQGDEGHYHDDELQIAWLLGDTEPWSDPDRFKSRLRAKGREGSSVDTGAALSGSRAHSSSEAHWRGKPSTR
jgi:hypothetical protein